MSLLALCVAAACGGKSKTTTPPTPDAGNPFADYDVSYSAGPFTVQPGTQMVMCTYVTAQNTEDEDVQSFLATQSAGGHHLIVYTVDHPINLPPTPCIQGGQPSWQQILGHAGREPGSGLADGRWLPHQGEPAARDGDALHQRHAERHQAQSAFGLKYSPPGTVTQQAHPYFFGTLNINVPPNASWSAQATLQPAGSGDASITCRATSTRWARA